LIHIKTFFIFIHSVIIFLIQKDVACNFGRFDPFWLLTLKFFFLCHLFSSWLELLLLKAFLLDFEAAARLFQFYV